MPSLDTPVMELLRDSTTELHKSAENQPMQRALAKGELPKDRYAAYLEQLWIVHRALEHAVALAAPREERLAGMEDATAMHVRHLEKDLTALGRDLGTIEPTPAAQSLAQSVERDSTQEPVMLAGHFYVLEGSMNGNQFIARAVQGVYGLSPEAGLAYLSSYRDTQRSEWASFKERMNTLAFTEAERQGLVKRAEAVFIAIRDIASELDSRA